MHDGQNWLVIASAATTRQETWCSSTGERLPALGTRSFGILVSIADAGMDQDELYVTNPRQEECIARVSQEVL